MSCIVKITVILVTGERDSLVFRSDIPDTTLLGSFQSCKVTCEEGAGEAFARRLFPAAEIKIER